MIELITQAADGVILAVVGIAIGYVVARILFALWGAR